MPIPALSGIGPWLQDRGLSEDQAEQLLQVGVPPLVGAGVNVMAGQDRSPLRRLARGALAGGGMVAGGLLGQYAQQHLGGTGIPSYVGPALGAALGGFAGYDALKSGQAGEAVDAKYPPMGTFLDTHAAKGFSWKEQDQRAKHKKCAAELGWMVGAEVGVKVGAEEDDDPTLDQLELDDEMQQAQRQWSPGSDVNTPLGNIVASPARQALIHGGLGAAAGAAGGAMVNPLFGGTALGGATMGGVGSGALAALHAYRQQRQLNDAARQLRG